jgi:LAS superfamily LD-carboxypeptidase LdcB
VLPVIGAILIFANCTSIGKNENQTVLAAVDLKKPLYATNIETEIEKHIPVSKNYLLGKISPQNDTLFVKVDRKYIGYEKVIYLRQPVYEAYKKMYNAALGAGVRLNLISGLRTFYHQKRIWENKWTGRTKVSGKNLAVAFPDPVERASVILKYSSMPGTSRHHWGTDIDIYSLNDDDFQTSKGKEVYNWLITNARSFGFCQVYTPKDSLRPFGYEEEKWHWSYFPISENLLKDYQNKIKYSDISGFKGDVTAEPLKVIENYVVSINRECK